MSFSVSHLVSIYEVYNYLVVNAIIPFCLFAVTIYPDKTSSKEKQFVLSHSFTLQVYHGKDGMGARG